MKLSVSRLCACAAIAFLAILSAQTLGVAQQSQTSNPQLSDSEKQALGAEKQALNAVNSAPDAPAKLAAATEFVHKFPKSTVRLRVAEVVANETRTTRTAPRAFPREKKAKIFCTADDEQLNVMKPLLVSTYNRGGRIDDSFKVAGDILAKRPDDINVLVQMTAAGA